MDPALRCDCFSRLPQSLAAGICWKIIGRSRTDYMGMALGRHSISGLKLPQEHGGINNSGTPHVKHEGLFASAFKSQLQWFPLVY